MHFLHFDTRCHYTSTAYVMLMLGVSRIKCVHRDIFFIHFTVIVMENSRYLNCTASSSVVVWDNLLPSKCPLQGAMVFGDVINAKSSGFPGWPLACLATPLCHPCLPEPSGL